MTRPIDPPRPLAAASALAERLAARIDRAALGAGLASPSLDGPGALRARQELDGIGPPRGRTSAGGSARLLRTGGTGPEGWIAVSLARASDRDALPAWLALAGIDPPEGLDEPGALEDALPRAVAKAEAHRLVAAAELLAIPVATPGEALGGPGGGRGEVAITDLGPARPWRAAPLRVVDLTALWAGPLCTQALVRAGAEVTRVESAGRPDASRSGSPGLFAALDQGKAHVVVDLATGDGVAELRALLVEADVVVSASRPRALEQLGITATNLLANDDGPQVWTSITGHGRRSARVAFGDDAAVAGGLVAWEDGEPSFVGDALADPLAGLAAAAATLEALAAGRRALVDVSMAGVAATAGADAGVGAAQT